jgi:hypothetical protein
MPYSTVTRTLRSAIWAQTDTETSHSEIDGAIVQALGQVPFAFVEKLAQRLWDNYCLSSPYQVTHFLSKHSQ